MLVLYTATLFVSATLLFLLQPMFAKMALPLLGGAPAVWNTFVVFFQLSLLAGYVYAHLSTRWLGVRRQAVMHAVLLLLPLVTLPIALPQGWVPPTQENPVFWLLGLLLVSVGLPFFIVSTHAPLLQQWFANTNHPLSKDPYFLYAASNAGSLLALFGYPLLLEPNLRLAGQGWIWACGYGLLIALVIGCGIMLWKSPGTLTPEEGRKVPEDSKTLGAREMDPQPLTGKRRIHWVALAFVPSSLLLGLTTFITTDLPAMPLFWTVPLAIYLFTFVLVFSRKPLFPHRFMVRIFPFVMLPLLAWMILQGKQPLWLTLFLHLFILLIASMVCHGELALRRPSREHLTEFYIWIAVGGVLGGMFNALLAPVIFADAIEYPIALVAACLLTPAASHIVQNMLNRFLDYTLPLSIGMVLVGLVWFVDQREMETGVISVALTYGLPIAVCLFFHERPIRFGLTVGAIMLASTFSFGQQGNLLHRERSFFGVYHVMNDSQRRYRLLIHGTTNHGMQSLDPARRKEPFAYYHPTGPAGQIFKVFNSATITSKVAVVGLGSGSMACYGRPGQDFVFYEIDPVVERIARNAEYFTFLKDCPPNIEVVLGDARLSLNRAPDQNFGLIVLDAFSSEAVPMHLLTREAVRLYLSKLAKGGLLVFHASNQHLDLEPILSALAKDAGLGAFIRDDSALTRTGRRQGKLSSRWVVMGRTDNDLNSFQRDARWTPSNGGGNGRVWTDDFSNILSIIRWNQL